MHVHPHPEILFRCLFRTMGGDWEIFPGTRRPRTAPNPYSGTSMSISTGFARAQESCHPIRYQSKFSPVPGTQNTRLLMRTAFARVPRTGPRVPHGLRPPQMTCHPQFSLQISFRAAKHYCGSQGKRRACFRVRCSTQVPGPADATDDKLRCTLHQKRDCHFWKVRGAMLIQPQTHLNLECRTNR